MNIQIEAVTKWQQWSTMCAIRTQVFTKEWGFPFTPLHGPGEAGVWHLLARDVDGNGIGTLSIVDTTESHALHQGYQLSFGLDDRVARYAQLAIMKPYRKLGILRMLIDEAQHNIIGPNGFNVGWLLYPAAHAGSCILTQSLGFSPESPILVTEFGRCRALIRREPNSWTMLDVGQQEPQRRVNREAIFGPAMNAQSANCGMPTSPARPIDAKSAPLDQALKARTEAVDRSLEFSGIVDTCPV